MNEDSITLPIHNDSEMEENTNPELENTIVIELEDSNED